MNRERILSHLLKLREHQLRGHSAELKARAGRLAKVSSLGEQARSAASDTLALPHHLADLGAIGAMRLECIRLAAEIGLQVGVLRRKVGRARKLTDAVRDARTELKRAVTARRDRSNEDEAEHFLSWKNSSKSDR
jgi:hypothetical protein